MPERKPGFLDLPSNHLASIPTAKNLEDLMTVKKTRSRVWDRENPNHAFRGINPELADKVKSIAQKLEVTQSDVARALIEDGLKQYWNGYFRFNPTLENGRRTLFPHDLSKKRNENRATRLKGKGGPYWKKLVSYRILEENYGTIKVLANQFDLPLGEIVNQLFTISIKRFEKGDLHLSPKFVSIKKGLF